MMVQPETRNARRRDTAEIFTPDHIIKKMLDLLPKSTWHKGKTFLDPAAGNGNILVWILIRKIEHGHKPLEALRTIYGVDIMSDNVSECRCRLLKIVSAFEEITKDHIQAALTNIVCANSLEYDFEFSEKPDKPTVLALLRDVKSGILDRITENLIQAAS